MPPALTAFLFRLAAVFGAALVLSFFSEFYFLNEGPARVASDTSGPNPELLLLTLVYGLFAYVFLILLDRFELRDLAGLLLAGAVFGWATEALVVPVAHEAPPVSWFWPSVGWHALVDVVLGWYGLRLAMRRLAWPLLALLFAALGVAWGFWGSWTWSAAPEEALVLTVAEFRTLALVAGTTWIVGILLADLGARRRFRATRLEVVLVGLAAISLYALTGLAALPWSLGLAGLVGLTIAALARSRGHGDGIAILARFSAPPPLAAYLAMPLLPLAAALTYPVVLAEGLSVPSEDIVALLLVAGGLAFGWALLRKLRQGGRLGAGSGGS